MWIDDCILAECHSTLTIRNWVPKDTTVVLGCSNRSDQEVLEENCARDNIPILKRYGGGGTVVLYPGCVVVSLGMWVKDDFCNGRYFHHLNQSIIKCLGILHDEFNSLNQRGISDIAFGDRKVGGTSMFRSRKYLLYQASLIVDYDDALVSRVLAHPSKEPEYRLGRSHSGFLMGLNEIVAVTTENVLSCLDSCLADRVRLELANDLIDPLEEQIPHLLKRMHRGSSV